MVSLERIRLVYAGGFVLLLYAYLPRLTSYSRNLLFRRKTTQ